MKHGYEIQLSSYSKAFKSRTFLDLSPQRCYDGLMRGLKRDEPAYFSESSPLYYQGADSFRADNFKLLSVQLSRSMQRMREEQLTVDATDWLDDDLMLKITYIKDLSTWEKVQQGNVVVSVGDHAFDLDDLDEFWATGRLGAVAS